MYLLALTGGIGQLVVLAISKMLLKKSGVKYLIVSQAPFM